MLTLNPLLKREIEDLIANEIQEDTLHDYKRKIPQRNEKGSPKPLNGNDDDKVDERKDCLKDVCSFSNTFGGQIYFGVSEKKGCPIKINWLPAELNKEENIRWLELYLRANAKPPLPTLSFEYYEEKGQGWLLKMKIPRSWNAPHYFLEGNSFCFWKRGANSNMSMTYEELRDGFALHEKVEEKIESYVKERVKNLSHRLGHYKKIPALILHVIPLSAFSLRQYYDLKQVEKENNLLVPLNEDVHFLQYRYNIDGLYMESERHEGGFPGSSLQIFRNGVIESGDALLFQKDLSHTYEDGKLCINIDLLEHIIVDRVKKYIELQQKLGIVPPILVYVSLCEIFQKWLGVTTPVRSILSPVTLSCATGNSSVEIPAIVVDDIINEDLGTKFLFAFDWIANVFGLPQSPNNKSGIWNDHYAELSNKQ